MERERERNETNVILIEEKLGSLYQVIFKKKILIEEKSDFGGGEIVVLTAEAVLVEVSFEFFQIVSIIRQNIVLFVTSYFILPKLFLLRF